MTTPSNAYTRWLSTSLVILLAVILLTGIGLIVLLSISQSIQGGAIFKKQLIWLGVACVMGWLSYQIDLEDLRQPKIILGLFFLGIVGLILVLIPGVGIKVNGAKRWLGIGPVRLQVSEFVKIILTILLSHYLSINQRVIKTFFRGFILPSGMIGLFCLLILMQPDFGTAFLCGMVGMSVLFLAGTRLIYLVPSVVGAMCLFGVAISLDPVRLKRITSFLDVEGNRTDGAYQLWQGILAFAAGGIDGVGLGNGRQQWSFLPEAHTDFIFPIIGEELGLVFSVLVITLFFSIFIMGIIQLRRAPNLYQFSLASGCLLFVILQSLINMGVVTGCLPTKGMSLPFISYGGSNLVVMFIFIGLLLNAFASWNRIFILEKSKEMWVV